MQHNDINTILKSATVGAISTLTTGTCELIDPYSTEGYPVQLTSPRKMDTHTITQFIGLLLDPNSWCFPRKRCLPRPTASFQMTGVRGNIIVLIEFSCSGWIVDGPNGRSSGFFDPVHYQIRNILKSIFWEYASDDPRSLWRRGAIIELRKQVKSHFRA